jgi:urease accessory protein
MTPATLLGLLRLASPSLPVGAFSYSEGLEAAVEHGVVAGEAGTGDWLLAQLELVLARGDAAVVARAARAWRAGDAPGVAALNDWVTQTRESAEMRLQTLQTGRSLAEWLKNGEHAADPRVAQLAALAPAPGWPVGFALAAVLAGAQERDTLLAFAFGWAENQAQAAMKAVPLGQAAAQRVLARLAAAIPAACERAAAAEPQAFAPALAILSARHEVQYSRLFRS